MGETQVIAIDGYAATGKSTIAKRLASHLGYRYMDTGAMFRCLTYHALQKGFLSDSGIKNTTFAAFLDESSFQWSGEHLNFNNSPLGDEIRSHEVSDNVSRIAALPYIRTFTLTAQRNLANGQKIVMDGRDIGTVVFPNARHKFFLTASAEVRAQRRFLEMREKGSDVGYEAVLKNVKKRDFQDSNRAIAPLVKSEDAVEVDTSNLTIEAVFTLLLGQLTKS